MMEGRRTGKDRPQIMWTVFFLDYFCCIYSAFRSKTNSEKGVECGNRGPHLPDCKSTPGSGRNRALFGDVERMIQITSEQIERVNTILSSVPKGAEKAISSVIRRANNTVRSETVKGLFFCPTALKYFRSKFTLYQLTICNYLLLQPSLQ